MSHTSIGFILMAAWLSVGCAHSVKPALAPVSQPPAPLPTLPMVVVSEPVVEDRTEVPCGHETVVKVGKLDVDMPKGGSLDFQGIKGTTGAYHILLEGVEFTNRDYCR
jgi:hypothetical protein